jgi:hypothetical protein
MQKIEQRIYNKEQVRQLLTARLEERREKKDKRFASRAIADRIGSRAGTVNNLMNGNPVGEDLLILIGRDLGLRFELQKREENGQVVTTFVLVGTTQPDEETPEPLTA